MVSDPLELAERHWGLRFKKAGRDEYFSMDGCPFCGGQPGRSDRFRLFLDGSPRVWCRQCDAKVFLDTLEDAAPLSPAEIRFRKIEAEQRRAARERQELYERMTALEKMARCDDHLTYHFNMSDQGLEYWLREGMTIDMIAKYQLGSCPRCPLWPSLSSYTIPVTNGGRLENIRHRLETNGNDKAPRYLPHIKGLGLQLFNADAIEQARGGGLLVTEGEKKAIHVSERVMPAVGIMGQRSFMKAWVTRILSTVSRVYVALDPDAAESAGRLAAFFGDKARLVDLPTKADDFFTIHGGSPDDFGYFLRQARPIGVTR